MVGSRRVVLGIALSVGVVALLAGSPERAPASVFAETQLMGTRWSIEVVPPRGMEREAVDSAVADAFAEVARVEGLASEWRPETPLTQVNRAAGGEPVLVPLELVGIIERSLVVSRESGGAFDITWRGMGKLWDLRAEPFVLPSAAEVAAARLRVDFRKVRIEGDRVGLADADMAIGLGGIAKGYAVDRAAGVLSARGLESFSVKGGGDLLVRGRHGDRPWHVGIRDPRGGPDDLLRVVDLEDSSVATSGDYERFRLHEGVRYHHIIDPRTGWPARGCRSVTIVARTSELADGLSTAVFVLGPVEGLALVGRVGGAEALVVDDDGRITATPGFPAAR